MKDGLKRAFDDVRADDVLTQKTAAYVRAARAQSAHAKRRSGIRPLRLAGALAAALVVAVGLLGYRAFYFDAAAYVGIDVNPSMELTLSRMDRVIAATAYNADGEALLKQVDLRGQSCDAAVSALLAEMASRGYVPDGALVTMTVQAADGAKARYLCDALRMSVGGQVGAIRPTAAVEVFPVTQAVRQSAHECHMSAAKYLAIQELMAVDEVATLEAYSDSTIRQIRQRTRACRAAHESGDASGGMHRGRGHHGGR